MNNWLVWIVQSVCLFSYIDYINYTGNSNMPILELPESYWLKKKL